MVAEITGPCQLADERNRLYAGCEVVCGTLLIEQLQGKQTDAHKMSVNMQRPSIDNLMDKMKRTMKVAGADFNDNAQS